MRSRLNRKTASPGKGRGKLSLHADVYASGPEKAQPSLRARYSDGVSPKRFLNARRKYSAS